MFNLHLKAIKVYARAIYSNMREERVLGFFFLESSYSPFKKKQSYCSPIFEQCAEDLEIYLLF